MEYSFRNLTVGLLQFVLIAAYTHYWTCYQVHHWRQMNPCEPLADLVVNTTLPYAQYEI